MTNLKELGADLERTGFDAMEMADIIRGKDVEFKAYDESADDVQRRGCPASYARSDRRCNRGLLFHAMPINHKATKPNITGTPIFTGSLIRRNSIAATTKLRSRLRLLISFNHDLAEFSDLFLLQPKIVEHDILEFCMHVIGSEHGWLG